MTNKFEIFATFPIVFEAGAYLMNPSAQNAEESIGQYVAFPGHYLLADHTQRRLITMMQGTFMTAPKIQKNIL